MVSFPFINLYSQVRSVLLTSLLGATQAEGQLTEVTATDVKAISTGRSQIIFANGVEVRKITCADDATITSKSKHPLNGALLCSNFDKDGYVTEKVHVIDRIMSFHCIDGKKFIGILFWLFC